MSDPHKLGGQGPLGTHTNAPATDPGTSSLMRNMPRTPVGDNLHPGDAFSEAFYYPVTATAAKLARKATQLAMGDKQGRQLLELWMSGAAPAEVTFDDDEWGAYMRAEPNLAAQIQSRLNADASALATRAKSSGAISEPYSATFHGQVGNSSTTLEIGGYFTGYQILHGSAKQGAAGDVQIEGTVTASARAGATVGGVVTFSNLRFVWNDVIDPNPKYKADSVLANYATWEKEYTTGGPKPRNYAVHIKWNAKAPVTIVVPGA
jgi:hypothetical protein